MRLSANDASVTGDAATPVEAAAALRRLRRPDGVVATAAAKGFAAVFSCRKFFISLGKKE